MERRGAVGVIANPLAGKDIRRLVTHAGHTPDTAKIGIVRRVIAAAVETGVARIVLAGDTHRLAERAAAGLDLGGAEVELIDDPLSGSRLDTIGAARQMWKRDVGALVVLGGDGTCRDVATGWPDAPLMPISTGTNNAFPVAIDATSAGVAAALVATGAVRLADVARRAKRIVVTFTPATGSGDALEHDDIALVDLAFIATTFAGARAVTEAGSVRRVLAAFASPQSTGLSSVAGRVAPCGRAEPGGVLVDLDPASSGRHVRVPLAPGSFATVGVASVVRVGFGEAVRFCGPGMLAFDGERDRRLGDGNQATAHVDGDGPWVIDAAAALDAAVERRLFDTTSDLVAHQGE